MAHGGSASASPRAFSRSVRDHRAAHRGAEFTVAVLDRRPLPLLEIVAAIPIFSFDAKYPARNRAPLRNGIAGKHEARLARVAVEAAAALGTSGLARVDLMLDDAGQPWVLEVNTVPGLTGRGRRREPPRGPGSRCRHCARG